VSYIGIVRVREAVTEKFPDLWTFFSSGSMVEAILNVGAPTPIDVQVSTRDLDSAKTALRTWQRALAGVPASESLMSHRI
jgi:hypothetical protein